MHDTGPPEKKTPPTLKSTASSSSEQVPCFCKAHPAFCGNHRGVRTRLARGQVPGSRCRKFWTNIISKFFQKSRGATAPNFGSCRGAQQIISHRGTETQSCQRMELRAKHGGMEHKYPSRGATAPNFGSCRGAQQIISHRGTETQSCQRMALRVKHGSMERKYPSRGATAPNFGSCRGCAARIPRRARHHAEASFRCRPTRRKACGRSPADWEGRIAAWEILGIEVERMEVCCAWVSKNFPSPPEAVPNLVRRGEAIRH